MLNEVAYKDLNNTRRVKTMKDLSRAAHSQGYEVTDSGTHKNYGSHGTVSLRHRRTGETVKPAKDRGAIGGKVAGKSGELDTTTVNTAAAAMKADMQKRGRVDKRPAAKAERAKQALANKLAKKKARDPFTRNKPTKTFEQFMIECAS